jgi:hypothetical protein
VWEGWKINMEEWREIDEGTKGKRKGRNGERYDDRMDKRKEYRWVGESGQVTKV